LKGSARAVVTRSHGAHACFAARARSEPLRGRGHVVSFTPLAGSSNRQDADLHGKAAPRGRRQGCRRCNVPKVDEGPAERRQSRTACTIRDRATHPSPCFAARSGPSPRKRGEGMNPAFSPLARAIPPFPLARVRPPFPSPRLRGEGAEGG
jgi:hypothetical protein